MDVVKRYQQLYTEEIQLPTDEEKRRAMLVCANHVDYPDQLEELLMCVGLIEYRY